MTKPQPDDDGRPLRVVVADDEPAALDKMTRLLKAHSDITLVAAVSNGTEAVDAIREHEPDIVFLDIRMPNLDGFGVVEKTQSGGARFHTVCVTASDEYAVQAFDVRALDYLLKPFDAGRLRSALDRAKAQLELESQAGTKEPASPIGQVAASLREGASETELEKQPHSGYLQRLVIRSVGGTQVVRMAEIEWIEAYGNYVRLHAGGTQTLARDTLRRLSARLDPSVFCRIHRSAIVNIDKVRHIRPALSGDSVIRLDSGIRLRLSRSYRAELTRRMSEMRNDPPALLR
jgi:two-component system LytT family response regulator